MTKRDKSPFVAHEIDIIRAAGHTPKALGFTSDGAPRHPLYLRGDSVPVDLPEAA